MDTKSKIELLELRMKKLISNDKENQGVCRKIQREIRKLKRA